MGRKYHKKAPRGANLLKATKLVEEEKSSIRGAAISCSVPNVTLQRYLNSTKDERNAFGYSLCVSADMVFNLVH